MMLWMVASLLLAGLFVIYPWLRRKRTASGPGNEQQANVALYREHAAQLQAQLSSGEIDPLQFAELESELKLRLLGDTSASSGATQNELDKFSRWPAVLALALLAIFCVGLYLQIGAARDVAISELLQKLHQPHSTSEQRQQEVQQLLAKLDSRLASLDKGNVQQRGVYLVTAARLLLQQGANLQSASYYQQAVNLFPGDAKILAEFAQASYFAAGNQFTPVVEQAIDRSLALEPDNPTALGLQGIGYFESKNYPAAISSWQAALRSISPMSPQGQSLAEGIEEAKQRLGRSGDVEATVQSEARAVVHVTLAEEFRPAADQVVYVFARQWQGPPMPLAVARLRVADLPTEVTLTDSMAMPGGRKLSSVEQIQLLARVSSTGSVTPNSGDLQGETSALSLEQAAQGVELLIGRKLP